MNPLTETLVMPLRIIICVKINVLYNQRESSHANQGLFLKDKKLSLIQNTPDQIWQSEIEDFNLYFLGAWFRSLLDFRP